MMKSINVMFSFVFYLFIVMIILNKVCVATTQTISTKLIALQPTINIISRMEYQQHIQGFWLGENIANWTGLITEMDKVGTPETMPFYTDEDWGKKDLKNMWGEYVPHSSVINFYFVNKGKPWGADDDTDIEYMYQYLLEKHKTALLTAKQIRDGWLTHIYSEVEAPLYKKFPQSKAVKENFLWVSNQRARILMTQGMLPPLISEPEYNAKNQMIDAQLTTEIFGILAPTRVDIALKNAYLPIRTVAKGESQWVSEFYIIMHSLAASVDKNITLAQQTFWLAEQARKQLPNNSYDAKMYDFIKNSFDKNPDKSNWEKTRDAIYYRYQLNQNDGYIYHEPFDSGINFAASLVSWFYGQGNIVRTIQIGSLVGWDADNPTATWGGLLGFIIGKKGIEKAFHQYDLSDTYWIHRTRRHFPDHTPDQKGEDSLNMMAARTIKIIDRVVIEQMNGKLSQDGKFWLIPKQK